MQRIEAEPPTAGDHSEAVNRDTVFDAGAGVKMKAVQHTMLVNQGVYINMTSITSGDAATGLAF